MRRLLPLVAVVFVGLAACGDDARQERFTGQLRPLNDSGVEGTVELVPRENDLLEVHIDASGLTPNRVHQQQIHGFVRRERDGQCPDQSDGLLLPGEAQDSYGEVIQDLAPYPTVGEEGDVDWELTVPVNPDKLRPLTDRVVVLYGMMAKSESTDGQRIYRSQLPVACGTIEAR